jgi:hypothetical protein
MSPGPPAHILQAALVPVPAIVIGLELEGVFVHPNSMDRHQLQKLLQTALVGFRKPRSGVQHSELAHAPHQALAVHLDPPVPGGAHLALDGVCVKPDVTTLPGVQSQYFEEVTLPAVYVPEAKRILTAVLPVLRTHLTVDPAVHAFQINIGCGDDDGLLAIPSATLVNVAMLTVLTDLLVDFAHPRERVRTLLESDKEVHAN